MCCWAFYCVILCPNFFIEGAPNFTKREGFSMEKPSLISISEDGSVLFVASEDLLNVASFDTKTGKEIKSWKVEQAIEKAHVSPNGSYVQTWHYQPRSKPGEPEPSAESFENFVVWETKTGKCVTRFKMKNAPETWPCIQWTSDEAYAARMTTNTVFVYRGNDVGGKEECNIHVKNLSQFSIICGGTKAKDGTFNKQYRVATFVPAKNNQMSQVCVYRINEAKGEAPVKEVTKTFGRGQRVDFLWNTPGKIEEKQKRFFF